MNGFKDLDLRYSYSTFSDGNVIDSFLLPVLNETKNYYRSVGFFTIESLVKISQGINSIIKKNGKIKLLCSYVLSDADVEILKEGYHQREKIIRNAVISQFNSELLSNYNYKIKENIIDLIKYDLFDLKVIVKDNNQLFHDKVGILTDSHNNMVAFIGSMNDTVSAYEKNFEKIRVFKSWENTENDYVMAEYNDFVKMWDDNYEGLKTYSIDQADKENIIKKVAESITYNDNKSDVKGEPTKVKETSFDEPNKSDKKIELRDYQKKAIESWVYNGYKGFYKMATGTGKTWTAIFSILRLLEFHNPLVIVVAPYKHLVEQWAVDLELVFNKSDILKVYSDNMNWRNEFLHTIKAQKYNHETNQKIIISTISSFNLDDFQRILNSSTNNKLLISDEAHRFYNSILRINEYGNKFEYKLGLSATPEYYNNQEKTDYLISFFGGVVFEYSLEEAIKNGYLVPYNYFPYYLHLTFDEQEKYKYFQKRIAGCFKNGKLICDKKKLISFINGKTSVLSKASQKDDNLEKMIKDIKEKKNLIVYCGSGSALKAENKDILRYIDSVTFRMNEMNYKVHKFTAEEDTKTRMILIDDFNYNRVDSLVAIRCLDEGVNIPSIKNALILSSSEDPREFVQRRGRILRKHQSKKEANIYDVIMLPYDSEGINILKSELKRFVEYSSISLNKAALDIKLNNILENYNLSFDDIYDNDFNNYDEMKEDGYE